MGLLRLYLATVVAMAHLQTTVLLAKGLPFSWGYYLGFNAGFAVMAFYMISGFLISMVLEAKYRDAPSEFYFKRAVRIFSLYLPLVALSFLLIGGTARDFLDATSFQKIINFALLGADWVIWTDPASQGAWLALPNTLHQAWTLSAELTFYLTAPWLLRSKLASGIALIGSAAIRFALVHKFGWSDKWLYFFLPSTFLFFLMGHWARLIAHRIIALRKPVVALGLVTVCYGLLIRLPPWDTRSFWVPMTCLALSLPGLFDLTKDNVILNWLGSLSYPMYLVHNMTRMLAIESWHVERLFPHLPNVSPATAIMAPYLLCVFCAAVAVHYLLEEPCAMLAHVVRRVLMVFRPRTAVAAPVVEQSA